VSVDYETYYQARPGVDGDRAAAWRTLSATIKAGHVMRLCQRAGITHVDSILEVGCGDGAVLAELHHRGIADRLAGVEISHTAASLARNRPEIDVVTTFAGERLPLADDAYDLVLATHVLEHVGDPARLLSEMHRVAASVVVIEVPLEANAAGHRPAALRRSVAAGHVQRFDRRAIRQLVDDTGLARRHELSDPLPRSVRVFQDGTVLGTVKWAARGLLTLSPGRGERWMTVHYAALASVGEAAARG
jgi:SAM-dependent methyltransferase